jgi:hypothetical protein
MQLLPTYIHLDLPACMQLYLPACRYTFPPACNYTHLFACNYSCLPESLAVCRTSFCRRDPITCGVRESADGCCYYCSQPTVESKRVRRRMMLLLQSAHCGE